MNNTEIYTIEWAVAQGLSIIRPREDWTFSRENGADANDEGTWIVVDWGRPHNRMPSISHMRQRTSETREDFIARLCKAGESDDCFGARETRASIQACGSLHDLDWLPTQD